MAAALLSRFGTFVTVCVRLFVSVTVFIEICKNRTIQYFLIYFRNASFSKSTSGIEIQSNRNLFRKVFYLLYSQIWFLFYWISPMKVMTN